MAVVVVLPWVPVIAMQRRREAIWASRSARWSSWPCAARRSGFAALTAVE